MRTLKFKFYQHKRNRHLKRSINAAGVIYNHCIALHRRYYRMWGKHLNCARLQKHIAKLRKRNSFWQLVGSQAVQDICQRIDKAYQLFFSAIRSFEPNSYGFRPGRSCHDAIAQIKFCIQNKAKFVLDADIAKCFDRINHERLLQKLNIKGKVNQQIKAWLKSGVIDQGAFTATSEGTPQGGVISPLLANIALHGLEERVREAFPKMSHTMRETWFHKKGTEFKTPNLIRYADDFVILHENKSVVQRCREIISDWLVDIGLELKPEKTRLTHTFQPELSEDGKAGFDFGLKVRLVGYKPVPTRTRGISRKAMNLDN